jgi:hypothetical protein
VPSTAGDREFRWHGAKALQHVSAAATKRASVARRTGARNGARGPRGGVLADPCRQDPDKWRADPDAWRTFDWAQRCRYHRENAHLAPPSPARVVFIGDSITDACVPQIRNCS